MNEWEAVGLVALAALLGALIGLEREGAGKPAGLRTHLLVSATAALIMVVGDLRYEDMDKTGDPNRTLHAVITGIGFICAGTILTRGDREKVRGLTTAASLFTAAAIGIAVASEYLVLAVGVTLGVLFVLHVLPRLEDRVRHRPSAPDPE